MLQGMWDNSHKVLFVWHNDGIHWMVPIISNITVELIQSYNNFLKTINDIVDKHIIC